MICAGVDGNGFVVETAEVFPECVELALVGPAYLEKLTFWADLSIMLEPSVDSYPLYLAVLMLFLTAWGIKQIARVILNR
jgi:hypothetical protein